MPLIVFRDSIYFFLYNSLAWWWIWDRRLDLDILEKYFFNVFFELNLRRIVVGINCGLTHERFRHADLFPTSLLPLQAA